jgi:hypothetical protein
MNEVHTTELELVAGPINALAVYSPGGVDSIIASIRLAAKAVQQDIKTATGRKAIASTAHKVSRLKVHIDGLGKDLVKDWKAQAKAVDTERARLRDELDTLRDEVRAPLTAWEDAEKARVDAINARIEDMRVAGALVYPSSDSIARAIETTENTVIDDAFDEFKDQAEGIKEGTLYRLLRAHAVMVKKEADLAELARLQAEDEERKRVQAEADRKAREERIRTEAAERAKAEAERKAEAARIEADAKAARAIEDERRKREAAEMATERAKLDAEASAIEAEHMRKHEAEKARIAAEKAERDERDAAEARRQNEANSQRIRNEIALDLDALGLDYRDAERAADAICEGKVRNVEVVW